MNNGTAFLVHYFFTSSRFARLATDDPLTILGLLGKNIKIGLYIKRDFTIPLNAFYLGSIVFDHLNAAGSVIGGTKRYEKRSIFYEQNVTL